VRGSIGITGLAESPPHPDFSLHVKSDLSPQAGRGEESRAGEGGSSPRVIIASVSEAIHLSAC
jgi:hypothetical protein